MKLLPKRHKYAARTTYVDGRRFDSAREARRYSELELLRKAGEIAWFVRQVPFEVNAPICGPSGELLVRAETYRSDFVIVWADGRVTVEDAKGMRTRDYLRKKARVEAQYRVKIEEV